MIPAEQVKTTFDKAIAMVPNQADNEEMAHKFVDLMSSLAQLQAELEHLATLSLMGLAAMVKTGEFKAEEVTLGLPNDGQTELRVSRNGVVLGSVTRYMHDTERAGDDWSTETSIHFTREGLALIDQFVGERAGEAKRVLTEVGL